MNSAMTARPLTAGLLISLCVLILDQASKWWILLDIMNPPRVIEVLPFFNLVLAWNRGISFGLFPAGDSFGKWLLIGVAAAIVAVLTVWLRRADDRRTITAIGLIVGGAAGNVADRMLHGAVVDFLDLHAAGYHWPAFNVADSAITVGAAVLILDSFWPSKHNGHGDSPGESHRPTSGVR